MAAAERFHRLAACSLEVVGAVDRFLSRAVIVAWITLAGSVLVFTWQAMTDRDPPFKVLSVEPAFAKPGDMVTIRQRVWRDPKRLCSASWSRFMWATGIGRIDLANDLPKHVGPDFINRLEKIDPGHLTVTVQVPPIAQPGPGVLVTELSYWCKPAQKWFPINVTAEAPFTVLPP